MDFGFGFGFGHSARRAAEPVVLPAPDPVVLTSGGSLRFPENNNETSIPGFRGFLQQPRPSEQWFETGSMFLIVNLPKSRRADDRNYNIYGDNVSGPNTHEISLYGSAFHNSNAGCFGVNLQSAWNGGNYDLLTPLFDEDSALVVLTVDGTNVFCDWYSLIDGTRHAGTPLPLIAAYNGFKWRWDWLIGGADDSSTVVNADINNSYFPGEIAVLGHVAQAVQVTDWQSIAQGVNPLAQLGATNMQYYRQFDGTSATYGPPAAATADATSAAVAIDGTNLKPGSDFWLGSSGLTFTPIPTRFVVGLLAGQTSRSVTFSGYSVSAHESATIEVQVFDMETGAVALDWTDCGVVTSGAWTGSVTVPQSSTGWVQARARVKGSSPEIIAVMADPFAVGWKFAVFGQSQMQISAIIDTYSGTPDGPMLASMAGREDAGKPPRLDLVRVRPIGIGDSNVAFRAQLDMYGGDNTPVQLCWYTENGTSAIDMIDDTLSNRTWANVAENAAAWGADITAVIWNWGTSDLGSNWPNLFDAVFDGTGPDVADHSLSDIFPAGFGRILSPLTRATTMDAGPAAYDASPQYNGRYEQIAYAEANGWTVGPQVNMQIGSGGGPHQDSTQRRSNPLIGERLGIAAARYLGLDTSTNPHLTGTAAFNAGKTMITVPVTLPNGGTLTAAAPNAITGFEVWDRGVGLPTRFGFTAVISGANIVLTKDTGAWTAGTKLRFLYGGPLSYGTAGPSEEVLLDGIPHETYALGSQGWGLPVDGLGPVEIGVV